MIHRHSPIPSPRLSAAVVVVCLGLPGTLLAQGATPAAATGWAEDPPVLSSLVAFARGESDLRLAVIRYLEDRGAIERRYEVDYSPVRHERLRRFSTDWQRAWRSSISRR